MPWTLVAAARNVRRGETSHPPVHARAPGVYPPRRAPFRSPILHLRTSLISPSRFLPFPPHFLPAFHPVFAHFHSGFIPLFTRFLAAFCPAPNRNHRPRPNLSLDLPTFRGR